MIAAMEEYNAQQEKLRNEHREWLEGMTPDEERLYTQIDEWEQEYFEDLRFCPGSITSPFIECQTEIDGEWVTTFEEVPMEMQSLQYMYFKYRVDALEDGTVGMVEGEARTLTIAPGHLDDKATILHEMIHAYEVAHGDHTGFFHDALLLSLYNKLKPQVPDLDDRIVAHGHAITNSRVLWSGGPHDILFFLKSLDLDLRCGYKLGTVCAYGRDEYGQDGE